jgi:hypothetical protein
MSEYTIVIEKKVVKPENDNRIIRQKRKEIEM